MKQVSTFVIMLLILLFSFSLAYADGYEVIKVGRKGDNGIVLTLSDDGGTTTFNAWADIDSIFENQALAVALTAKSSGLNIEVGGPWVAGRFTTITLVDP